MALRPLPETTSSDESIVRHQTEKRRLATDIFIFNMLPSCASEPFRHIWSHDVGTRHRNTPNLYGLMQQLWIAAASTRHLPS